MSLVRTAGRLVAALAASVIVLSAAAPSHAAPGHYGRAATGPATVETRADPTTAYEVDVVLAVGQDFQSVVDANPAGTTYLVSAGVHREQQVVAKAGDVFVGETGAVMSGARDLTGAAWAPAGDGTWSIGGQTQEGFVHGTIAQGGNPRDAHPEELFVDGARWTHVASTGDLRHGAWHFDYAADRIHIGADPATLGSIETSTTSGAFGGTAVAGVVIDNLVIRHYASPGQHGAIGFFGQHHTHDWTVRNSTVIANHGAGIRLGPGMVVESSEIADNGQIGLAGNGVDTSGGPSDGYAAPVVLRGNDIHHNLQLSYAWGWEGGAMKIKLTPAGSLVEGNWVHDNRGPGIWFDVDNTNAVVRHNLVERNEQSGIFYEISHGATTIEANVVRDNGHGGVGDEGAGIDISNSTGVTVVGNDLAGNRRGILVRDDGRAPGLRDVVVQHNDVEIVASGWTTKRRGVAGGEAAFVGNRYYGPDTAAFRADEVALDLTGWLAAGYGSDEQLRDGGQFAADGAVATPAAGAR